MRFFPELNLWRHLIHTPLSSASKFEGMEDDSQCIWVTCISICHRHHGRANVLLGNSVTGNTTTGLE